MKRFKERLIRILYADTTAAEMVMGIVAVSIASPILSIGGEDRTLAIIIMFLGSMRIVALLSGLLWFRLAVAYTITFAWVYFIMFVFLEAPSPHLPGGIASAVVNAWLAWRLQSESHVRKALIKDGS